MNAINVIAPYKHHGQWVFDDPALGCHKSLLSPASTLGSTAWWLTFPTLSEGSLLSFPAHLFQGINTASIGNARKAVETGIIPRISTWKAGCVRLSLNISLIPRKRFMRR